MIRSALSKMLGGGCDGRDAELQALRAEVSTLRARVAELERAEPATGPAIQAGSFAEAAKALAGGQRVSLDPDSTPVEPASAEPAAAAEPAAGRRIVVELEDCIACGTCVEYCTSAFELGSDGRAIVLSHDAPADQVEEAMEACPTQCIVWQD